MHIYFKSFGNHTQKFIVSIIHTSLAISPHIQVKSGVICGRRCNRRPTT